MRMEKDTYDMTVKRRCRKYFRRFTEKRLKDVKNARVLCFPGEECIEIYEVYDKLGVPRKNIVCLERDARIFDVISAKKLGCDVRKATFHKFIETYEGKPFNVISLDFMGQLISFEDDIYCMIAKGMVADNAVVFTNFCGARETDLTKLEYMQVIAAHGESRVNLREALSKVDYSSVEAYANSFKGYCDAVRDHRAEVRNTDLATLRDEGIWLTMAKLLYGGGESRVFKTVRAEMEIEHLDAGLEEMAIENNAKFIASGELSEGEIQDLDAMRRLKLRKTNTYSTFAIGIMQKHIELVIKNLVLDYYETELIKGEEHAFIRNEFGEASAPVDFIVKLLSTVAPCLDAHPHDIWATDSFRYVGSNGMPMMADLFYIKRMAGFKKLRALIDYERETLKEMLEPLFYDPFAFFVMLYECRKDFMANPRRNSLDPPERTFLGSERLIHPTVKEMVPEEKKVALMELLENNPDIEAEKAAFLIGVSSADVGGARRMLRSRSKVSEIACPE